MNEHECYMLQREVSVAFEIVHKEEVTNRGREGEEYKTETWFLNETGERLGFNLHQCTFPNFVDSLNECFKYLEPPLRDRFGIYHIGFGKVEGIGQYTCYMYRKPVEWPYRTEGMSKELSTLGHGETLGAAFCDAALQVINKYPELEKDIEQVMDKGGK